IKVSRALSSVTDMTWLVKRIVAVIAQISGATDVGLFVQHSLDPDPPDLCGAADSLSPQGANPRTDTSRWTLVAVARAGHPVMALRESAAMAASYGFTAELVGHALGSLRPELIDDVRNDHRFRHEQNATQDRAGSALLLPIVSRDRPSAMLLLENRLATRFFTAHHLDTLELITGQLSTSLQNAALTRSMEQRVTSKRRELADTVADFSMRDRALAAATDGVSVLDAGNAGFTAVYVNPAFERITGYAAHEVLGRSLYRLYGADTDQPGIGELRDAIRAGVGCRVTVRCYRRNGEMFWNEVSVAPVMDDDGRPTYFVCINVDVTAQQASAAAERLRSERLAAVFELSPDGFVVLDADERVISINPAFKAMTGMSATSLLGLGAEELEAALAGLAGSAGSAGLAGAGTSGGSRVAPWHVAQRATLRLLLPRPRVLVRHTRRGMHSPHGTVLYFRDVTREAEIDRMKSEFLATAAHELRTPMTSVYGFTELLLNQGLEAGVRVEMLEVIHRQTAALTALLDELLDLARIEAGGRARFDFLVQPLQAVVQQVVGRLNMPHDLRRIEMKMPREPLRVRVDAEKLALALTNALSNARKYSSSGPIVVEVGTRAGSTEIGIQVSDEGIGMTPGQTARMFDRFFQVDPHQIVKGTGLGTNIMKEIVEAHGGRIEVSSRLHSGTVVTFWLPGVAAIDAAGGDRP
ncbi:MAG: histidine kinase, partial [Rhizobacter sp.]|nr:histidine kinase [Rhizobacter sp.]